MSLKKAKGFTLIELVVVIVILGILSVVAAPKFLSFTTDARVATLKGIKGNVESAIGMFHARSMLDNISRSQIVTLQGQTYMTTANGYPLASAICQLVGLSRVGNGDIPGDNVKCDIVAGLGNDFASSSDMLIRLLNGSGDALANCHVHYRQESNEATPVVSVVSTGC
ncbi:type II secretion system protein [Parasalinivibrio latis]|uniref:type II secretion system protein n=1 Tax=Parasalinivibrio latis TaxID=2952610 RepID=UPI0030E1EAB6